MTTVFKDLRLSNSTRNRKTMQKKRHRNEEDEQEVPEQQEVVEPSSIELNSMEDDRPLRKRHEK